MSLKPEAEKDAPEDRRETDQKYQPIRQESGSQMKLPKLKSAVCNRDVLTTAASIFSLVFSGLAYIEAVRPKETKLTIVKDYKQCFSGGLECSQLFIFTNKGAPCFDLKLNFDEQQFKDVNLLNGFIHSGLLNAERKDNGTVTFPAMALLSLKNGNRPEQGWLGFLQEETPVYIAFIPHNLKATHKVAIHCAGYDRVVELKMKS